MRNKEFSRHGYLWTPTRRELLKTAGGVLAAGLLAPRVARAATFTLLTHGAAVSSGARPTVDSTGADLLVWGHTRRGGAGYVEGFGAGTDSLGNLMSSYTKLGPYNNGGDNATVVIYFLRGGTFGAGHTIYYGGGDGSGADFVAAWSGSAASPIDQSAGSASAGNVSTIQPGSITPTMPNELVIALLSDQAYPTDRTHSVDGSMTQLDNIASPDYYYRGMVAYVIQTAAAAINPTFTATGTAKNLAAMIVSFKSTSSGGGKVRHRVVSDG
jgi:hypothetical protein